MYIVAGRPDLQPCDGAALSLFCMLHGIVVAQVVVKVWDSDRGGSEGMG